MITIIRRCLAALLALVVMLPAVYAQAAPEFMPVDQIVKGMHGIAKTVVAGDKIEEFDVEVIDVMKQKGPSGDLILVRTYGDVIERTGGIAQGMSGSPVYIDGKLVGAIAYGWSMTDHKIGMVTPIADMLKLWELNSKLKPPAATGDEPPGDTLGDTPADIPANTLSTPLMASGFGEQALQMLTDKLKPYNLTPYSVGGSLTGTADTLGGTGDNGIAYKTVQPGSTVGVQLVRGDISLGALGTVTYVEGDKMLAFGHPFLKRGKANYFLTDAQVYTTLNGLENSFKVGNATEAIGMINQDRGAGIAGKFGQFPSIVPLRITVTDKALDRTQDMWAQVVQDEELAPMLSAVSVFNAIEKTTDRVGSGSARVSFEISATGIPGEVLKRENMFYTQGNIGELAVAEVHEALALLAGNQFNPVDIMDVKVNVVVDPERRTASIVEAQTNIATAKPGDNIDIAVKIKPFRSNPITRHITLTVPKDQQAGTMVVGLRGGGMISLAQLVGKRQTSEEELSKLFAKARPKSLEEAVRELANRDRNNDIVAEIIDMGFTEPAGQADNNSAKSVPGKFETDPTPAVPNGGVKTAQKLGHVAADPVKGKKSDDGRRKFYNTTEYIIDGDAQVIINVTK